MLTTIVRALFVFVMLCLVSATRPTARPVHDDPANLETGARLEVAKHRAELATARRDGDLRERDRDQRANSLAVLAPPFTVVPPPRTPFLDERCVSTHTVTPIICARSSRGPPVG